MTKLFQSFISDETGAVAIEYALIAVIIAIAIISQLNLVRDALRVRFDAIANSVRGAG